MRVSPKFCKTQCINARRHASCIDKEAEEAACRQVGGSHVSGVRCLI